MDNCQNCLYWLKQSSWRTEDRVMGKWKTEHQGICRKNPPTVNANTGGSIWPRTMDYNWCGSFMAKEKE